MVVITLKILYICNMEKKDRLEIFKRELGYIHDDNIRKFAEKLLEECNDYFFTVPASSSGKYHPVMSLGDGGLVRHTKAVAYFANEFARAEVQFGKFDDRDCDLIVLCAIAHDIKKQGENAETHHTVNEHPQLAAQFMKKINDEYNFIDEDDMDTVFKAVSKHMGPWGEPKPSSLFERTLFYADYTASRKELDIKFISDGINEPVERETYANPVDSPKMTVDDYVFHFGKTKGMTIAESVKNNKSYVDWILRTEGFSMTDVKELVREYYKREGLTY